MSREQIAASDKLLFIVIEEKVSLSVFVLYRFLFSLKWMFQSRKVGMNRYKLFFFVFNLNYVVYLWLIESH